MRLTAWVHRLPTVAGAVVLLVGWGAGVAAAAVTLDHATQEIYGIPPWGVALTVGLVAVLLAGAALVVWSRQAAFAAVVMAAAALGVLSTLAMFSVGLLLLPVAAGLAGWACSERWRGPRRVPAVAGAVLAGAVLPVLVVFAIDGPLVECGTNSAGGGENLFLSLAGGEGAVSSSSSFVAPDGTAGGRATGEDYEYSFSCRDGKVVEFELRWR